MEHYEHDLAKREHREQVTREKLDYIISTLSDAYYGVIDELRAAAERSCEHAGISDYSDDAIAGVIEECIGRDVLKRK